VIEGDNETVPEEAVTNVAIRDEQDDGGDEGGQQQAAQGGKPPRKERRQAEWREVNEKARKAEEYQAQLEEERRQRQALAEQVAELRGRTEAIQQSQRPAETTAERVKGLREKSAMILRQMQETKDPAVSERLFHEWHDTNDAIQDIRSEEREGKLRQEIGRSMPDVQAQAQRTSIETEFPWVSNHAQARQAAIGYEQVLLANGEPPTMATTRKALLMAARDHKLGGESAPSEASRRRFALPSGRDTGAGGGESRTVPMNDALKKIAEARYPQLEAAEAHARWATEVGQKVMQKNR